MSSLGDVVVSRGKEHPFVHGTQDPVREVVLESLYSGPVTIQVSVQL